MTEILKNYWSQQELADRYGVSESTIKNWRDKGHLPYLSFPGSTRVLYPVDEVLAVEAKYKKSAKEVDGRVLRAKPVRKMPVVSPTPEREWRI